MIYAQVISYGAIVMISHGPWYKSGPSVYMIYGILWSQILRPAAPALALAMFRLVCLCSLPTALHLASSIRKQIANQQPQYFRDLPSAVIRLSLFSKGLSQTELSFWKDLNTMIKWGQQNSQHKVGKSRCVTRFSWPKFDRLCCLKLLISWQCAKD